MLDAAVEVAEGGGEAVGDGVGVGVAVGAVVARGVGVALGEGAAAARDRGSESPHAADVPNIRTDRNTASHTRTRMRSSGIPLHSDSEANDNTGPKTVNAVNKPAKAFNGCVS
ncbi:MAG: hypothetical protein O3A47_00585 [Chloroflexi bacterium]|nr:hypothetical protein [Chloroflexota bacterium]